MKNVRIITLASLLAALSPVFSHAAVSPFGINFGATYGNPTSGTYDGVLFSDWTLANAKTAAGLSAPTAFTLPQSSSASQLTGWFASNDYWNPVTTGVPNTIFGSTLGGNVTAGLSGYSDLVQFTNVAAWLSGNGYSSLNVTVYYSSYATLNGNTTDASTAFAASYANVFSGIITVSNASTFTSTQTLIGGASGTLQGTGPYYYSSTISGITNDFLVAELLNSSSLRGGIAAIKIDGVTAVPEPATYGLLGAGALAATSLVRRRRKA